MKNAPEKQSSPVRRITVDEKLSDNLVRILVADLKPDEKTFNDDPKHWGEEEESFIGPDDYRNFIGTIQPEKNQWPWKNLREGQVFLKGRFWEPPDHSGEFAVDMKMKRDNFQRIDYFSKKRVKKAYMNAMERSIANDETNQIR